jgi:hypothetical protein
VTIVTNEFVLSRAKAAKILTWYFLSKTIWFNILLAIGGMVLLFWRGGPIPVFMILIAVAWPWVLYFRNYTLMTRGEGKAYGVRRRMSFDDRGVAIIVGDKEIRSEWKDFARVVPTWGGMLLFLKNRKFVILPSDAFEPKDLVHLYTYLKGAGMLRLF